MNRTKNGTLVIHASTEEEMYEKLGYAHAKDRGLQMLLLRILGKGRASEFLDGSDHMVEIDKFFRKLNWYSCVEEVKKFDQETLTLFKHYNEGINKSLKKNRPWELKLVGYHPEKWTTEDSVLLSRMTGFLTLAQSEGEIEHLIVQLIQKNVSKEQLEELFPDLLNGCDFELIKKVKLGKKVIPDEVKWLSDVSPLMASNNWVIGGDRSESSYAILCNDPHLETNRLPNIWYEVKCMVLDRYFLGFTMPGLPAFLVGRNNHLSWGATYSFMDATDFWIETCKNGQFLRDGKWHDFNIRKEIIKRKKGKEIEIIYYENDHGILDGDPFVEGCYLTMGWTGSLTGAASTSSFRKLFRTNTVREAQSIFKDVEVSFNWILADRKGNIGFQMSGLMPVRRKGWSGFYPIDGSVTDNNWKGFVKGEELPKVYNPNEGFFVTANQDLNQYGHADPSNISMGNYRTSRIQDLICSKEKLSINDMKSFQMDVYSKEAEEFMEIFSPYLKDCDNSNILKQWDFCYNVESKGACLFEKIMTGLYLELFGAQNLGVEVGKFLDESTGFYIGLYKYFNKILLKEESSWFKVNKSKMLKKVIHVALNEKVKPWGEENQLLFKNVFFDGRLPKFLGFDIGPIALKGGRATIHQGQIYTSSGRVSSFSPSIRFITDMGTDEIQTCLAGGASGNRLSKYYKNRIKDWNAGNYDILSAND